MLNLIDLEPSEAPETASNLSLRDGASADLDALAVLMIDAYLGTIDYDGETLEDALNEVQAYQRGDRGGQALLDQSRLAFVDEELVGACLASMWRERGVPVIAYVMTAAGWKGHSVAKLMLRMVLEGLAKAGYDEVRAVITEGNIPSERLFASFKFRRVVA